MEAHNKERPHTCVQCQQSFGQAANLKRHMLTHCGVKTHTCSECKKSFGRGETLREHMITHSGDKVHRCVHRNAEIHLVMLVV